jgi:hypothetical protein
MIVVREPVLHPVAIADLRPTQITVGMREVEEKRTRFRRQPMVKVGKFLGGHMIPVIKGPKNNLYVIDHHHLALALHKERIPNVLVITVSDLSSLDMGSFWTVLDHRAWVHPYDAEGRRRSFRDLPKSVASLEDDPFRSLAGAVRRAGGFAKDTTPSDQVQGGPEALCARRSTGARAGQERRRALSAGLERSRRYLSVGEASLKSFVERILDEVIDHAEGLVRRAGVIFGDARHHRLLLAEGV